MKLGLSDEALHCQKGVKSPRGIGIVGCPTACRGQTGQARGPRTTSPGPLPLQVALRRIFPQNKSERYVRCWAGDVGARGGEWAWEGPGACPARRWICSPDGIVTRIRASARPPHHLPPPLAPTHVPHITSYPKQIRTGLIMLGRRCRGKGRCGEGWGPGACPGAGWYDSGEERR